MSEKFVKLKVIRQFIIHNLSFIIKKNRKWIQCKPY